MKVSRLPPTARGPKSVFKKSSRLPKHAGEQESSFSLGVSACFILVIARANQGSGIATHTNTNRRATRRTATALPQQALRKRRGAACLNGRGETEKHTSIMSRDPHMDSSTVCDPGNFFFFFSLFGVICLAGDSRHVPPQITWPGDWIGAGSPWAFAVTRSVLDFVDDVGGCGFDCSGFRRR